MADNLPTFAIQEISSRLPCDVDRLRMSLACRAWRKALTLLDAPPLLRSLPWLVFPFQGGPSFFCLACGNGVDSIRHRVRAPEPERVARYFGSHDGRWVMVARNRTSGNTVLNVCTGDTFSLPDTSVDASGDTNFYMFIHAAVLSTSPEKSDCIGAAIVHYIPELRGPRRVAFFSVRTGHEYASDPLPEEFDEDPEDLIYFDGCVCVLVLTREQNVRSWRPVLLDNGDIVLVESHLYRFTSDEHDIYNQLYGGYLGHRYLVHSRGELLMVVKLSSHLIPSYGLTSGIRVFRMIQIQNGEEIAGITQCTWEEMQVLEGRMLFIGRGCSRSYEVADFPSLQEGIYFADDRTFHDVYRIEHNLPFPCRDNGRWIGMPQHSHIHRCFPVDPDSSDYSSPIWLLP